MGFTLPPPGTILYKYYPPDTAIKVLGSGSVRFSPFLDFNDPFELNIHPNESFTPFDFGFAIANNVMGAIKNNETLKTDGPIQQLIKAFQEGKIQMSAEDFAMDIGVMMANKKFAPEPSNWSKVVHHRMAQAIRAFCLSERFDNLLMWAHYAKDHKGYVVGFDVHQDTAEFARMAPMVYRDEFPTNDDAFRTAGVFIGRTVQSDQDFTHYVQHKLLTKSSAWAHEKEWRALGGPIEEPLVRIQSKAFVSLHVGCRDDNETTANAIRLAKSINPEIKVYRSRISTRAFSLEFQDFDEPWKSNYPPEDQVLGARGFPQDSPAKGEN